MSKWDGIPDGFWSIEAYTNGQMIVVLGTPRRWETLDEDDPRQHNCDAMGCGSVGGHVLAKFMLPHFTEPTQEYLASPTTQIDKGE